MPRCCKPELCAPLPMTCSSTVFEKDGQNKTSIPTTRPSKVLLLLGKEITGADAHPASTPVIRRSPKGEQISTSLFTNGLYNLTDFALSKAALAAANTARRRHH
eukprot:1330655-Amphidinium_carterae.2